MKSGYPKTLHNEHLSGVARYSLLFQPTLQTVLVQWIRLGDTFVPVRKTEARFVFQGLDP